MRIEISYHGGSATIGQLWSDYHSLQKHSDAVGQSMQSLIRFAYNMNGGVGCLQDAVSDLHYRSQQESEKQQALGKIEEKLDGFLEHAQSIDKAVAAMVTQNQDEFYQVSGWAKPGFDIDGLSIWKKDTESWLERIKSQFDKDEIKNLKWSYLKGGKLDASSAAFEQYFQELLQRIRSGDMSVMDQIEAKAMLESLVANGLKGSLTASQEAELDNYLKYFDVIQYSHPDDVERFWRYFHHARTYTDGVLAPEEEKRILQLVSLYEAINPEVAEKVRLALQNYGGEHTDESAVYLKYALYKAAITDGELSEETITALTKRCSSYPSSLIRRICLNNDNHGTCLSLDQCIAIAGKGTDKPMVCGNAFLYDIEKHANSDGSVDVTLNHSINFKNYTEITVYNADGTVCEQKYFKGRRDPSTVWDSAKMACITISDVPGAFSGKTAPQYWKSMVAHVKEPLTVHVPEGGYIQFTGDPLEMNYQKVMDHQGREIGALTVDTIKDVGLECSGLNAVRSAVYGKCIDTAVESFFQSEDIVEGTPSTRVDEVGSTITDFVIDVTAATPVGGAFKIAQTGLKVNKVVELFDIQSQQEKLEGTGSLFIYP